jgi:hypothetical protein
VHLPTSALARLAALLGLLAGLALPDGAQAGPLRPLFSRRPSYGESFTFVADLEDRTYVHLTLSLTNLGPGSMKGICHAVVVSGDGAVWRASTRVGRDELSFTDGPPEKVSIGRCSAWDSDEATGVDVQLDEGTVKLAFAGRLLRRSPREAIATVGDDRYQSEVLAYRMPVTATLALKGRPARSGAGLGYIDHSRSTVQPKDLAKRWVRFRGLRGDRGLLVLGREAQDGRMAPLWACRDVDTCRDLRTFSVARTGPEKAPAFTVELKGDGPPIKIASGSLLIREAPVEDLGLLGKMVAPFTGSPVTYTYRAQALEEGSAPTDGILEVEVAGE